MIGVSMKKIPSTCKRGHVRFEPGRCRECKRLKEQERYQRMKALPARKLISDRREASQGRQLFDGTCGFGHAMEAKEHGVHYCDDELCGVLVVAFDFPGAYRFHKGTKHLYFSRDEANDYLHGQENRETLIERKIGKANRRRRVRG